MEGCEGDVHLRWDERDHESHCSQSHGPLKRKAKEEEVEGDSSARFREKVRILVDPICPWTLRTAMWLVEVRRSLPLDIEWGLLSLEYVNRERPEASRFGKNRLAMRVLSLVSETKGMSYLEKVYFALAKMVHGEGMDLESEDTVLQALLASGLEGLVLEEAKRGVHIDQELWQVYASHCASGAFGVPTLYLGSSQRPFYGPVIDRVPEGQDALALWEHVRGLVALDFFYELKRAR
jgi:hypothetical protein